VVNESAATIVITVRRLHQLDRTSKVSYTVSAGSATAAVDFTPTSGVLKFKPGQKRRTITVKIANDGNPEGNELFHVSIANPIASILGRSAARVTIVDDDA